MRTHLISFAVLALSFAGCDQPAAPQPAPATATTRPASGKQAACLPCGGSHVFDVTDKTAHADVDGKTYHFCSDRCKEVFVKDTKKYIK